MLALACSDIPSNDQGYIVKDCDYLFKRTPQYYFNVMCI